ncbi:energy transducer TonB [Parabacteroides sp. PF5-9]|uniref:energy transducer TonB n=1 Tax=Parabacteroides sp. PF5-9 TaxID=1742404 RepID=UPI002476E59E|nr:energy transducer TonB [Parabacteroides sp. PF5-9]MDH6356612.1 protein TonB [Parabacteroides sp. PF5-9]
MEAKKSAKANLEKSRTLNLLIGVVVAVALMFVGFEWGTPEVQAFVTDRNGGIEWVDEIPYTKPEPPQPPPPPLQVAVVTDVINVVKDDVEVPEGPIVTTEDYPNNPVEPYIPSVPTDVEVEDPSTVFILVEEMPEFPGGDGQLLSFISKSIKYPVVAQENGIQGRVTCSFVVNTDGSIVDAEIARSIDPALDKEALRVISMMPKWKPGKQRGKPVRVKYTVPITFRLQ